MSTPRSADQCRDAPRASGLRSRCLVRHHTRLWRVAPDPVVGVVIITWWEVRPRPTMEGFLAYVTTVKEDSALYKSLNAIEAELPPGPCALVLKAWLHVLVVEVVLGILSESCVVNQPALRVTPSLKQLNALRLPTIEIHLVGLPGLPLWDMREPWTAAGVLAHRGPCHEQPWAQGALGSIKSPARSQKKVATFQDLLRLSVSSEEFETTAWSSYRSVMSSHERARKGWACSHQKPCHLSRSVSKDYLV